MFKTEMMVTLNRKEALTVLSLHYLIKLSDDERENVLLDMVEDYDESQRDAPDYNEYILSYFNEINIGVRNDFLAEEILSVTGVAVTVSGMEEDLNKCPCCGFKTLKTLGEYEICRVCRWEDDGNRDPDKYSSPNRQTLREARKLFEERREKHDGEKRYRMFSAES
jgi:hypothetical protein